MSVVFLQPDRYIARRRIKGFDMVKKANDIEARFPAGGVIPKAGSAHDYQTGGWRKLKAGSRRGQMHQLSDMLGDVPGLSHYNRARQDDGL